MKSVLFVGWSAPYPGLERRAITTFGEFLEALTELQAKGEIERFEAVMLPSYGGDLEGFVLVYGEQEKLAALPETERMHRLEVRAHTEHGKLVVIPAITGERVVQELAFREQLAEEAERELVSA
jgi:hypothetical protein